MPFVQTRNNKGYPPPPARKQVTMPFVQTCSNKGYPPPPARKQVTTLPHTKSMSGE